MDPRATRRQAATPCLALLGLALAAVRAPASGTGGAERYVAWLTNALGQAEASAGGMRDSAEAAAALYTAGEADIGAWGDPCVAWELQGRSGGLIRQKAPSQLAAVPKRPTVVMLFLDEGGGAALDARLRQYETNAAVCLVAFGRRERLDRARAAGARLRFAVETFAAPGDGLLAGEGGRRVVPTEPVAGVLAAWAWTGEFAAACTRRGRMPVFYQGHAVPGGQERTKRVGRLAFHPEAPPPVEAGRLARAYVRALRADVERLAARGLGDVRRVAALARAARAAGRQPYLFLHGHATVQGVPGRPSDPGVFRQLNADWFRPRPDVKLAPGDFVFCVGFDSLFHGGPFGTWDDDARAAGARLAWSFSGYQSRQVAAIPPGEPFVDQGWGFGDAAVEMPGYGVPILPTGGVLALAVVAMVEAECVAPADAARAERVLVLPAEGCDGGELAEPYAALTAGGDGLAAPWPAGTVQGQEARWVQR